MIALALWTLCCHAVVAAGGTLRPLILLYGVVGLTALVLRRRILGAPAEPPAAGPAPGRSHHRPDRRIVCAAGAAAGAVGVGLAAVAPLTLLWWWTAAVLAAAAVALLREPPRMTPPARGRALEVGLWALAFGCVVLTLASHRPNIDDAFYVNVAVAAVDRPHLPLLAFDTLHGIEGLPLHLPIYRVHSYELLNGALSLLTGIPAITCFHWVSASVAALFVPLAYARLFRRLAPRWWLFAAVALVIVLVAVGGPRKWYGNKAFLGMWLGKSIFLSVFWPLIYAYALDFALRPTRRGWIYLAAAQVAAVGCSSTALWAAPVAALTGLASGLAATPGSLRRLVWGGLSSTYIVAAGALLKGEMQDIARQAKNLLPGRTISPFPGEELQEALHRTLGDSRLWLFAMAAILLAWVVSPRGLGQRFSIVVPLAVWGVLLNPYAASWMVEHVTGPSYWRSLWALPVPILMTLLLIAPLGLRLPRFPAAGPIAACLLLALFVVLVPRFSSLSPQNLGLRFGLPALKVPSTYAWAEALNRSVPPGAHVVAPREINAWVPTFHHHAYPLAVRNYLGFERRGMGEEERRARLLLTRYVAGKEIPKAAERFRGWLERFDVDGVCLRCGKTAQEARGLLRESGFCPTERDGEYEIWVRCGAAGQPADGPSFLGHRRDRPGD